MIFDVDGVTDLLTCRFGSKLNFPTKFFIHYAYYYYDFALPLEAIGFTHKNTNRGGSKDAFIIKAQHPCYDFGSGGGRMDILSHARRFDRSTIHSEC